MRVSIAALSVLFVVYLLAALIAIYSFGGDLQSDVLINVSNSKGWEPYIINVLFILIAALHIPLIFFVGKESLLIMIYECRVGSKREQMRDEYARTTLTGTHTAIKQTGFDFKPIVEEDGREEGEETIKEGNLTGQFHAVRVEEGPEKGNNSSINVSGEIHNDLAEKKKLLQPPSDSSGGANGTHEKKNEPEVLRFVYQEEEEENKKGPGTPKAPKNKRDPDPVPSVARSPLLDLSKKTGMQKSGQAASRT